MILGTVRDLSNRNWLRALTLMVLSAGGGIVNGHGGHDHGTEGRGVRTWTIQETGETVRGAFVSVRGNSVQVSRSDGKMITLDLASVSAVDQAWVTDKQREIRELNARKTSSVRYVRSLDNSNDLRAKIEESFSPFAKLNQVKYRRDESFFYVESNSMPDHPMMIGITAWQQQVPIPQPYTGSNAWRIPLNPVVAKSPMSAKSHFFRGAIALAANGVPIFNPIKNDGRTDTLLAGELDEFGGHCGRADDYHYHIAPTHLQQIVGNDKPIAYALDGYPIYGYTEPDGAKVEGLDAFNGHETPELGYHYHATKKYPYLNGGFHGEVVEVDGQVDPQPRAGGVRPALPPLRGAKIVGFESKENKKYSLKLEVGKETRYVNYELGENGAVRFEFVDGQGNVSEETYTPRQRGPGGQGQGGQGQGGKGGQGQGGPGGGGAGGRGPGGDGGPGGVGGRGPSGGGERGKGGANERGPGGGRDGQRGPGNGQGNRNRDGRDGAPEDSAGEGKPPVMLNAKRSGNFRLTSPAVADGDPLPNEFNGNGEGATLPLDWKGAPKGTKSYAIVMDHIDRDDVLKTYWVLYDIPADVNGLAKNTQGIGQVGATWKRDRAYVAPHSAGGAKQTYTLHIYALSDRPKFESGEGKVTRDLLLTKIQDLILDSADLNVTYMRPREGDGDSAKPSSGDSARKK